MADYTRHDREKIKQELMNEMLETWQTVAALAIRTRISPKLAHNLLMELRDENKIIMRRGMVDGHNMTALFKIQAYNRVLGMRIPKPDLVSSGL